MPGTAAPTESTEAAGAGCGTAGRAVGGDQPAGAVLLSSLDHLRRVPLLSGHGLLFLCQSSIKDNNGVLYRMHDLPDGALSVAASVCNLPQFLVGQNPLLAG